MLDVLRAAERELRAGEQPQAEDYRARFLSLEVAPLASTLAREPAAGPDRSPVASGLGTGEFAQMATPLASGPTRIRCPHCHNPIQLVDDRPDAAPTEEYSGTIPDTVPRGN